MQSGSNKNPYEFILKEEQTHAGSKFGLPKMSMPVMIVAVVLILMVLVIIYGVAFGKKNNQKQTGMLDILGQAQEISRVSTAQENSLHDPNVIDVEATAKSTLTSDQAQIKGYLTSQKVKVDEKKLATYENPQTDSQLKAAAQNNNLDKAYTNYLKSALAAYSNSVKSTYSAVSSQQEKVILSNSYDSAQVLLSSPVFK